MTIVDGRVAGSSVAPAASHTGEPSSEVIELAQELESVGMTLPQASSSTSPEPTKEEKLTPAERGVALRKAFLTAMQKTVETTMQAQHFYRPELAQAIRREPALAPAIPRKEPESDMSQEESKSASSQKEGVADPDVVRQCAFDSTCEPDAMKGELNAFLDALHAPADVGWRFRLWRDVISLVANGALAAIIAQRLLRDAAHGDADPKSANTPFDVPWADWLLLSMEGVKGIATQALGYPTLIRHHAVDELVKRMDAGGRLLAMAVDVPRVSAQTTLGRRALALCEKMRDVATGFTLANTCVPPARASLWASQWHADSCTVADVERDRGWLRMSGLVLDSLRAVTSLAGTAARKALFVRDIEIIQQRLTRDYQSLSEIDVKVSSVLTKALNRMQRAVDLMSCCDTPLLVAIADSEALSKTLLSAPQTLTFDRIRYACIRAGVPIEKAYARERAKLGSKMCEKEMREENILEEEMCEEPIWGEVMRLSLKADENAWGKRWRDGAWRCSSVTSVRIVYRMMLIYQRWGSGLPEWVVRRLRADGDTTSTSTATSVTNVAQTPNMMPMRVAALINESRV